MNTVGYPTVSEAIKTSDIAWSRMNVAACTVAELVLQGGLDDYALARAEVYGKRSDWYAETVQQVRDLRRAGVEW